MLVWVQSCSKALIGFLLLGTARGISISIPGTNIDLEVPQEVEDLISDIELPTDYENLLEELSGSVGDIPGITPLDTEEWISEDYVAELNGFIADLGANYSDFTIPTTPEELEDFEFPEELGLGEDFRLPTTVAGWENFTVPEGAFESFEVDPSTIPEFIPDTGFLCNFCDTGAITAPDNTFGGLTCSDWESVSTVALADQCTILRAAAVEFCGCPTTVTERCDLCPDGSLDVAGELSVTVVDLKCDDISNMVAVDGANTCNVLSKYAYVCRCPGVVPSCTLCPSSEETLANPDFFLPKTDATEIAATATGTTSIASDTSCDDYNQLLSTLLPIQAENSICREQVNAAQDVIGFDVQSFCGCPTVDTPVVLNDANAVSDYVCEACPTGMIPKEDLDEQDAETCQSWVTTASFVMQESVCTDLQGQTTEICCVTGTADDTTPDGTTDDTSAAFNKSWLAAIILVASFIVALP